MIPIKLRGTPITEETFKKQGWTKETEEDMKGNEYSFWICALPKNSKDPYTPCFISSPTNQKFKREATNVWVPTGSHPSAYGTARPAKTTRIAPDTKT